MKANQAHDVSKPTELQGTSNIIKTRGGAKPFEKEGSARENSKSEHDVKKWDPWNIADIWRVKLHVEGDRVLVSFRKCVDGAWPRC